MKQRCLSDDFIVINDKLERSDRGFISNKDCGEESKIAERQRERETVRGCTLRKRRDGNSHKMSHYKENMWHKSMGLISKVIDKMLMMLLPWFAFGICSLYICQRHFM